MKIIHGRLHVDGPDSGHQHVDLPRGTGRQVQACPRLQSQVVLARLCIFTKKIKNYTNKISLLVIPVHF
jgi:hypothetical protein